MKKFFKILMVLALLSGAALSCTKDYSKEIADVQKQNQDLQALVASLQNALNSTNATVGQLTSASDKSAADILKIVSDINAQKGDISALIADVKTIEALNEVFAQLGVDLSEEIEDQALLIAALQAQAKELEKGIETVEGKATANAAAIAKIDETLKGIASTLDLLEVLEEGIAANKTAIEANKTAIAANKTAIEAAQKDIEAIKEKIDKLSARLTNIVAAPAKDVEIQGVKFADIKRSVVNMNFVVAPASAAEAIAAGNADVKLVLTNGKSREIESKPAVLNYTVTPKKITAGEKGVINVFAVEDTIFDVTKYGEAEKIYAALIVSGEDKAGEFERISDPVAVITGETTEITAENFQWFKDGKAVPTTETVDPKNANHSKDSVVVVGKTLTIVAADADWTNAFPAYENVLEGYEFKYAPDAAHTLSIAEIEDLFELEGALAPHYTTAAPVANTKGSAAAKPVYTTKVSTPVEWDGYIAASEDAADATTKELFKVTADTISIKLDFKIVKPADKVEEIVGTVAKVITNPIRFGKLLTSEAKVVFYQRIGKHVEEEEAAEPLTLAFGVEDGAAVGKKKYESVKWLSTTQIKGTDAEIFTLKDGKIGEKVAESSAKITPIENKPKFVDVEVVKVPYTKDSQNLRIVLSNDAQKNVAGVVVLEHGDYIDLTVAPYHKPVDRTTTIEDFYLSRKTGEATIKTDITVKNLFSDINDWLIEDAKTAEDSAIVYNWFKTHNFNGAKCTAKQNDVVVGTANLLNENDTICVKFTADKKKFEEGKDVTVSVKDTIDGVIAFNYNVTFGTIKPGVKVATIDGFVVEGTITVGGKLVGNEYKIDDINLANYFKVVGLGEKSENDEIKVKFTNAPTGVEYSASDTLYTVDDKGALPVDSKVKWDTLKATSFQLTAQAMLVEKSPVGEAVTVTVKTADPILAIDPVKIDSTLHGKQATFELLKNLKIYSILDATSIYPDGIASYGGEVKVVNSDMSDWSCTVNGVDYKNQIKNLCSFADNKLTYNAHDALGTVVITIPYKFIYKFGEKKFDVILTIK